MVICICGCSDNKKENYNNKFNSITTEEVFNLIDSERVAIIDVRESYEYKSGHIRGAYNIPLSKIETIINYSFANNQKIVVYCQSGNRSKMALAKLLDMGYTNVYDMSGIDSWKYELVEE